jgi:hypothetical protein
MINLALQRKEIECLEGRNLSFASAHLYRLGLSGLGITVGGLIESSINYFYNRRLLKELSRLTGKSEVNLNIHDLVQLATTIKTPKIMNRETWSSDGTEDAESRLNVKARYLVFIL